MFFPKLPLYHKAIEEAQQSRVSTNDNVLKPSGHACRKHSPVAPVFFFFHYPCFLKCPSCLITVYNFFVRTLIARARMYVRNSRQRSYAKPIAPRPLLGILVYGVVRFPLQQCIRLTGLTCRTAFVYEMLFLISRRRAWKTRRNVAR